jgi:hypothetical protein
LVGDVLSSTDIKNTLERRREPWFYIVRKYLGSNKPSIFPGREPWVGSWVGSKQQGGSTLSRQQHGEPLEIENLSYEDVLLRYRNSDEMFG